MQHVLVCISCVAAAEEEAGTMLRTGIPVQTQGGVWTMVGAFDESKRTKDTRCEKCRGPQEPLFNVDWA